MLRQRLGPFSPHALHASERHWPETNCYVDLWIEVLADRGLPPEAMLGFTVRQDFEGDQFTFFKVPLDDLEELFSISVQELALFDDVERHLIEQIGRGRLPLVEIDGLYLPDTAGVSYGTSHSKTTIAPVEIDPAKKRMAYFHNAGFFSLEGDDYDGVFRRLPHLSGNDDILFPYTEFAKFGAPPAPETLPAIALKLLKKHLKYRPASNPVDAFRQRFPAHVARLTAGGPDFFHVYAFNTLRQLGANFELLAAHLAWLGQRQDIDFATEISAATTIAGGAKAFQFQLARGMARGRLAGLEEHLAPLVDAYDAVFDDLSGKLG